MGNLTSKQTFYAWLGAFLEYPTSDLREAYENLVGSLDMECPEAASYMKDFFSQMSSFDLSMRQEHYVQTFDVMPKCSLYLSVQLFGEESFKRAELMAGLKSTYEKKRAFEMTELPDHLSVVLKQNALFSEEEWAELVSMCILPALPKIMRDLKANQNPYALVLKAVETLMLMLENVHV